MYRKLTVAICAAAAVAACSLTAVAEPSAEDAFKYRQAVMTSLRGHIGAASMIVRGLVEDKGYLEHHALGLKNGVAEIHRVFQHGSVTEESEALPVIWEDPEKFREVIKKSETATAAFYETVAGGGDDAAIGAAFREVGMSCRGCHDDFRVAH